MCPACLATLALIVVGAASTGGLTTLVAKKLHREAGVKQIEATFQIQGGQDESSQSN